VAALTINKVCGSGLKAVMLAQQGILTGDIDIAVAGGMESMSNAPYLLPRVREGLRMGHGQVIDSMIHDGLWCPFENWHMGNAGETVADAFKVTRDEQDQYSVESHKKAAAAHTAGKFTDEMLPVSIPQKKGDPISFDRDESVRGRHDARGAARAEAGVQEGRLGHGRQRAAGQRRRGGAGGDERRTCPGPRPHPDGPHRRAGHERPGAEDAADDARGSHAQGAEEGRLEHRRRGPARAERGLRRAGGGGDARTRASTRRGERQRRRRALGHAIGSSGARILTTLLYALKARGGKKGVATLCLGGGNGVALAVEMI
jgi:acetyl-CoA C-acetyltransferase